MLENTLKYLFSLSDPIVMHCTIGYGGQQGFEMYKKWTEVDSCFSFNKPTNLYTANVQKSLKPVSVEADFLYVENIDQTEQKLKIAPKNRNIEFFAIFTIGI